MPLPKSAKAPIETKRIVLTSHGVSRLAHVHRHTVLRALARGSISAEAWLDYNGILSPLFLPDAAIELARSIPSNPIPPVIS